MSNNITPTKQSGTGRVLKNSFLYSLGEILNRAMNVILLPIYTRYLGASDYGKYALIISFISVFAVIESMSLRAALMRFVSNYKDDPEGKRRFFGTIVTFTFLSSAAFTILFIVFKNATGLIFKGIEFWPYVFLGIIALMFDSVFTICQSISQSEQKGLTYSVVSIANAFLQLVFGIIFVVILKQGLLGMINAHILSKIVMILYYIISFTITKQIKICIDKEILKTTLKYSVPIIPHNLSSNISAVISRFFLNSKFSSSATGIFSVSSQLCSPIGLVQNSVNLAFRPWYNQQMRYGDEGKKRIAEFANSVFAVSCTICLGSGIFAREIVQILTTKEFYDAWKIVPILSISYALKFIYYIYILGIMYNIKASKYTFICSFSGCIVNVVAGYFLIDIWGALGAAIATLLSSLAVVSITMYISQKYEKVNYPIFKMLMNLFLVIVLTYAALFFDYRGLEDGFNFGNILYKVAIMGLGTFVLMKENYKNIKVILKNRNSSKSAVKPSDNNDENIENSIDDTTNINE